MWNKMRVKASIVQFTSRVLTCAWCGEILKPWAKAVLFIGHPHRIEVECDCKAVTEYVVKDLEPTERRKTGTDDTCCRKCGATLVEDELGKRCLACTTQEQGKL